MDDSTENRVDADAVDAGQQDYPPPYLKLIVDCWEDILDYLSFKDILLMAQTCKLMNRIAGHYLCVFHPRLEFQQVGREIELPHLRHFQLQPDFYQFISHLHIGQRTNDIDFLLNIPTSDSLKTLIFDHSLLAATRIRYTRNVLKHVETIHLIECRIGVHDGNIFEQFVNYCPHLKHLNLRRCRATNAHLFSQYYPALEHLQFRLRREHSNIHMVELQSFLERHSNLNWFETSYQIFMINQDVINQTNVQLDCLTIHFESATDMKSGSDGQFIDFLLNLYERGFYKSLQLSIRCTCDNATISILPGLESVALHTEKLIDLSRLTNLKELHITKISSISEIDTVARDLQCLERLTIVNGSINAIASFTCHSKKLKSFTICYLPKALKILDLSFLNQERNKLTNPCQVSLYLPEKTYLAEKWKSKNLKLCLIKVMRLDSRYFHINW